MAGSLALTGGAFALFLWWVGASKPSVASTELHALEASDHLLSAENVSQQSESSRALQALRKEASQHLPSFEVLIQIGWLAREAGQLALSVKSFKKARTLEPENPEIYIQLARSYLELKQVGRARRAARKAVQLAPEEALPWNLLGRAEMCRSQWHAAQIALEQALMLDPTNPFIYNNMGLLRVYMRQGSEAIEALETAIILFRGDVPPYTYNNLGLAFELEGRLVQAQAAFAQALHVSPFYVKARVNLERVERTLESFSKKTPNNR